MPEPPPEEFSRRTIAMLAGGGLAVVAIAGLLFAALSTGGDEVPKRPAAIGVTPAPVVPVESEVPASSAGPGASSRAAGPKSSRSASGSPKVSATGGPPRVLSVSVSADPDSFSGCRGVLTAKITVRLELSGAGAAVRYTINDMTGVRRTASGTSFAETTQVLVAPTRGEHRIRVTVSQPSAATGETTVRVDCGR